MKIPASLYQTFPKTEEKVLQNLLHADSDQEFLSQLRIVRKNELVVLKLKCKKQLAQVLDRCDSILSANNDISNQQIKNEQINLDILKFLNIGLENLTIFKLFSSIEYIAFILDTSETFECLQRCIRIFQIRLSQPEEGQSISQEERLIQQLKINEYVNIGLKNFNFSKDNKHIPLYSVYQSDPRLSFVKSKAVVKSNARKSSSIRKGSVQERILRLSCDISHQDADLILEESNQQEIQLESAQIYIELHEGEKTFKQLVDKEKNQNNEDNIKKTRKIAITPADLNLQNTTTVEIARKLIKQFELKINENTPAFLQLRMQLLFLKKQNIQKESDAIVHFFINVFKIHCKFLLFFVINLFICFGISEKLQVKHRQTENTDEVINVNELLEELVSVLYLKTKPDLHWTIIRFIRYYFKSYVTQNYEFFLKMLSEVSHLKLNQDTQRIEFENSNEEERILPFTTASNIEFQMKLLTMMGEKIEIPNFNVPQQIAPALIRIAGNKLEQQQSQKMEIQKLVYHPQIASKARQVLIGLLKNEEVNREFGILDKHIIPQLENEILESLNCEKLQIWSEKTQIWKGVESEELFITLGETITAVSALFRNSNNQRASQAMYRKLNATQIYDHLIYLTENGKGKGFQELFVKTLVLTSRLISEQPSILSNLITKGLIKAQIVNLSKEPLPQDVAEVKQIVYYLAIVSIIEQGKALVQSSNSLAKVFSIFALPEYVECITASSISPDPNLQSQLNSLCEHISGNRRAFEVGVGENQIFVTILTQTFESIEKQKEDFLARFFKIMDSNSMEEVSEDLIESTISEYYCLVKMINNFGIFFSQLCKKDQFFTQNSEKHSLFALFLRLAKFPKIDMADPNGQLEIVFDVGFRMGLNSILKVFELLRSSISSVEKMLGCVEKDDLYKIKDLSAIIPKDLFLYQKQPDIKELLSKRSSILTQSCQLFTNLKFIQILMNVLWISLQQGTEKKIDPIELIETVERLQHLQIILQNQLNNEHQRMIEQKLEKLKSVESETETSELESEIWSLFNQSQGMSKKIDKQQITETIRILSATLLMTKKFPSDYYIKMIHQILTNISSGNLEDSTNLGQLSQFNCGLLKVNQKLDLYIDEARKKAAVSQELVLDLNPFVHLREQGSLQLLVETIKQVIFIFTQYKRVPKDEQTLKDRLTQATIESLVEKTVHIISNYIGTPLDISQDVVVQNHKLTDVALEGISNGINYYFIHSLEQIFAQYVVHLQQEPIFHPLLETLYVKAMKLFSLVGKPSPLKIDLQKSIKEKRRLEELEKKKKFNADVQMVVEMGFPRRRVVEALQRYQDINSVVEHLTRQQHVFGGNQDNDFEEFEGEGVNLNAGSEQSRLFVQGSSLLGSGGSNQKLSLDLTSQMNDDVVETSSFDGSKRAVEDTKVKIKNEDTLVEKVRQFRDHVSRFLLLNFLKLDAIEILVCDLILKASEEENKSGSSLFPSQISNLSTDLPSYLEITQILLWNLKHLSESLSSGVKFPAKVLPTDYKSKIVFSSQNEMESQPSKLFSHISKIILVLTKFGLVYDQSVAFKRSVGIVILKFLNELLEKQKQLLQNESNEQNLKEIQEFFSRCVIYSYHAAELAKTTGSGESTMKDQSYNSIDNKKIDQSVSSLLSKDSKNQDRKKESNDFFSQLLQFIVKSLEISASRISHTSTQTSNILQNGSIQGILTILCHQLERNTTYFSKQIQSSPSLMISLFKITSVNSLAGILPKLCHFYSLILNDEDVEQVSLEAQIKSFFLYEKHSSQKAPIQNQSTTKQPIRVLMDTFLPAFTQQFSQIVNINKIFGIFGRLCSIKKVNGSEWIELDPEVDIHRCILPVVNTAQNIAVGNNSEGLVTSPTKTDFSSRFMIKNTTTKTFLNQLIDNFVRKFVERVKSLNETNEGQKQSNEMLDEGMLLNVIYYIVKKFPLLVPTICRYKVSKLVQKVMDNDQKTRDLLKLPQVDMVDESSSSKIPETTFLEFLSRVVIRFSQTFARDLILDLCIDNIVTISPYETYASVIRNQIASDILNVLNQNDLLSQPNGIFDLITYSNLLCVLMNLKQFKAMVQAENIGDSFLSAYNKILKSLEFNKYYTYESVFPFIQHPLAILYHYGFSNAVAKSKKGSSTANQKNINACIYKNMSAQFVQLKYAAAYLAPNFANEWNTILSESNASIFGSNSLQAYENYYSDRAREVLVQYNGEDDGLNIAIEDEDEEVFVEHGNYDQNQEDGEQEGLEDMVNDQRQNYQELDEDEEEDEQNQADSQMLILESMSPSQDRSQNQVNRMEDEDDEEDNLDEVVINAGQGYLGGNSASPGTYNNNGNEASVEGGEEYFEEEEEGDVDDEDDEDDQDIESDLNTESKDKINTSSQYQSRSCELGGEKDLDAFLKFNEKQLFSQQQINSALTELLKKKLAENKLGSAAKPACDFYAILKVKSSGYFASPSQDWKNLVYQKRQSQLKNSRSEQMELYSNQNQFLFGQRNGLDDHFRQYSEMISQLANRQQQGEPLDDPLNELLQRITEDRRILNIGGGLPEEGDGSEHLVHHQYMQGRGGLFTSHRIGGNPFQLRGQQEQPAQNQNRPNQQDRVSEIIHHFRDALMSSAVDENSENQNVLPPREEQLLIEHNIIPEEPREQNEVPVEEALRENNTELVEGQAESILPETSVPVRNIVASENNTESSQEARNDNNPLLAIIEQQQQQQQQPTAVSQPQVSSLIQDSLANAIREMGNILSTTVNINSNENPLNFAGADFGSLLDSLQNLNTGQAGQQQVNVGDSQAVQEQQVVEEPPSQVVEEPSQQQPVQEAQAEEVVPEFMQRSAVILEQFGLDLGFFERNELDPLYFDELPDDIKTEIILNYLPIEQARQEQEEHQRQQAQIANQRQQQQLQQQIASQQQQQQQQQQQNQQQQQQQQPQNQNGAAQNNPQSAQAMQLAQGEDTAAFLASLPPHLRDEILITASQDVLNTIPAQMRQHAYMLQQMGAAQHNEEVEISEMNKREAKRQAEAEKKRDEVKEKLLRMYEQRRQLISDQQVGSVLKEMTTDERISLLLVELLFIDTSSFSNYPYNLVIALNENPFAEFKYLDCLMFILRSPGILVLQNQLRQSMTSEEREVFPPTSILRRQKEPLTSQKEVYEEVAKKILFIFLKLTEKQIYYFIDQKNPCLEGLSKINSLKAIKRSSDENNLPFLHLTQLLTSELIFKNSLLLELLIRTLHNISKKYYSNYFTVLSELRESASLKSGQNLSIKCICQVLSSDQLSRVSVKRISQIINYMCIDEQNLVDFIAELKTIIRVFTEDINSILEEALQMLRINPKDQKPLKIISENVEGVSKVQKMFQIVQELFEKSLQQKGKNEQEKEAEMEEEEESKESDKQTTNMKSQMNIEPAAQKEKSQLLSNIRERIAIEFTQLISDNSLRSLWINLSEVFSIVGEFHNQSNSSLSVLSILQPLLESFLLIQFNSVKQGQLPKDQSIPPLPTLSPNLKQKSQVLHHSEEFQISHLSYKEVREKHIKDQMLFFFVCEKSKVVINNLIRAKLKEISRMNQESIRSGRIQSQTILNEPVGMVFKQFPKIIDFENKKVFFLLEVANIRAKHPVGSVNCRIRRKEVLVDSYYTFNQMKANQLKARFRIEFEGEEGIDAGGLSREWFIILSKEIFNPNYCLFLPSQSGNTFQPNPNSHINNQDKQYFKFVGRIVGKALFDGFMLDAYFTRSFYKHILGQEITYHDIQDQDNEFYKNMKWIVENDVTPLELTFVYESDQFGRLEEIELKPQGKITPVTEDNKLEYVHLICHNRMTKRIQEQIRYFVEGFHDIIPQDIISIFDSHELELMISGLPDIDLADLRDNTEYHNYTTASNIIQWFWEIMGTYDNTQKAAFIQFVTGTSKVPLEGFSQLRGISGLQKFQIHKAYGTEKLPTTHTCFNQLDLPEYASKEILAEKLSYAILEGKEGFGFA